MIAKGGKGGGTQGPVRHIGSGQTLKGVGGQVSGWLQHMSTPALLQQWTQAVMIAKGGRGGMPVLAMDDIARASVLILFVLLQDAPCSNQKKYGVADDG